MMALPAASRIGVRPIFRHRRWQPAPTPWQDAAV
jgi:hypothetical protein